MVNSTNSPLVPSYMYSVMRIVPGVWARRAVRVRRETIKREKVRRSLIINRRFERQRFRLRMIPAL